MKKYVIIILLIAVIFLLPAACDHLLGNRSRNIDIGTGPGNNESGQQSNTVDQSQVDDNDNEAQTENGYYTDGTERSDAAGANGAGNEPVYIIEINEDRIYLNGNEITFTELEKTIIEDIIIERIWELHDGFQAVKNVYDEILDLLKEHDVIFTEKKQ